MNEHSFNIYFGKIILIHKLLTEVIILGTYWSVTTY